MQQTRKPGPQRALVLAGGGAKGSYQVGVWQALQELGWTPDIITGASVGALNGCLFTMGKSKEAEDLWRRLEIHDVLEVPDSLKPEELNNFFLDVVRSGGLNVEPLAETIDRLIDEDAVRRSPIRFGLVMTELGTMRRVQCPGGKSGARRARGGKLLRQSAYQFNGRYRYGRPGTDHRRCGKGRLRRRLKTKGRRCPAAGGRPAERYPDAKAVAAADQFRGVFADFNVLLHGTYDVELAATVGLRRQPHGHGAAPNAADHYYYDH